MSKVQRGRFRSECANKKCRDLRRRLEEMRQKLEDAYEVLTPFALFATAFRGKRDNYIVRKVKHQSMSVYCLRAARDTCFRNDIWGRWKHDE